MYWLYPCFIRVHPWLYFSDESRIRQISDGQGTIARDANFKKRHKPATDETRMKHG